jgi:hypothetical protein
MEKAARQIEERMLSPLEAAQRAKVVEALFDEERLGDAGEQAFDKLFPTDEAREKFEDDLKAFLADALGGYLAYGPFDRFDMRYRVELPGILLRANGDLSRLPAVAWRIAAGDLVLAPPLLSASSFVPSEGVPGEGWDAATLDGIAKALAEVPAEQRGALGDLVGKSLRAGFADEPAGLGEAATAAYRTIRDALGALVPPEPPGSGKLPGSR